MINSVLNGSEKGSNHQGFLKEEEQNSNANFEISGTNINQTINPKLSYAEKIEERVYENEEIEDSPQQDVKNEISLKEQIENQESNSHEELPAKGKSKKFIIIGVIILSLLVIGLGVALGIASQNTQNQEETLPVPPTVLRRDYSNGNIYHIHYTVFTEMQGHRIRINYTAFCGVLDTKKYQTTFVASLQKRSQEIFKDNETETTLFDESNKFEQLLKNGINNIQVQEFVQSDEVNETAIVPSSLPIFKFTLYTNGSIASIVFPKRIDSQTLGLIRSFSQLISPELSEQLYKNKKEGGNYEIKEDENTVILEKKIEEVSEKTHPIIEKIEQKTIFSKKGSLKELKESMLSSLTTFNSKSKQQDKSLLPIDFASKQIASLVVLENFVPKSKNFKLFASLFANYDDNDETYTMSLQDIVRYLMDKLGDSPVDDAENLEEEPGNLRLLQEDQDTISLIKYDKQVKILNSKVLEFDITAYGYIKLNIKLQWNPQNIHEKNPTFDIEIGTVLHVNKKKYVVPLHEYKKKYPVLTLKHTLELIEEAMSKMNKGYLAKVDNIQDEAMDKDSKKLFPQFINLGSKASSLIDIVKGEESKRRPSVLNNIFGAIKNIYYTLKNQQALALGTQKQFQNQLTSELNKHVRSSYKDGFVKFNKQKSDLNKLKESSSYFFDENVREFKTFKIEEIKDSIDDLIDDETQKKYNQEMSKTANILKYIKYVQTKGKQYEDILEKTHRKNKDNLFDFVEETTDLFVNKKVPITDSFYKAVNDRYNNIENELNSLKGDLIDLNAVTTKVNNYFWGFRYYSLDRNYYYTDVTNRLNQLSSYANEVRHERGDCCRTCWSWFRRKCCNHNDARDYQYNQINNFNSLRSNIQYRFTQMAKTTQIFMRQVRSALNSNDHINTKLNRIKVAYGRIYKTNLDDVLNIVLERKSYAQNSIRNRVQCGGHGNLDSYIVRLGYLYNTIYYFRSSYNSFNSKYYSIINSYNGWAYNQIQSYYKVRPSTDNFLNYYKDLENKSKNLITGLKNTLKSIKPEEFVKNFDSSKRQIINAHNSVQNSLDTLCNIKDSQKIKLVNLRKQYEYMLGQVLKLPSNYLNDEVIKLKNFLTKGKTIFTEYEKTNFCQAAQSYKTKMENIPKQIQQYGVLKDIYDQFEDSWKEALSSIDNTNKNSKSLEEQLNKLTNKKSINSFIENVYNNFVKKERLIVDKIGTKVSELKQRTKETAILTYSPNQKILDKFRNTEFILSSDDMFRQIISLKDKATNDVKSLDEDVLTGINAAKQVRAYMYTTIQNMGKGMSNMKSQFTKILQDYLKIDINSNVNDLEKLQSRYNAALKDADQIAFPSLKENRNKIKDKYQDYDFTDDSMEELQQNALDYLDEFYTISKMSQRYVKYRTKDYKKRTNQIIEKLEIQNIVKVDNMASFITTEYSRIQREFSSQLNRLLSIEGSVNDDFRKLFKFDDIYQSIENNIESNYKKSVQRLDNQVKKFRKSFDKYSDYFNTLKVSKGYKMFDSIGSKFQIDFYKLFSTVDAKNSEIKNNVKSLKGKEGDLMGELSYVRNTLENVQSNTNSKVQNVKDKFEVLENQFEYLNSLTFVDTIKDVKEIKQKVNQILKVLNQIKNDDLGKIKEVSEHRLPTEFSVISNEISKIMNMYKDTEKLYNKYIKKLNEAVEKIDSFTQNAQMKKFQKLKEGFLFIKRKTNLKQPIKNAILFKQQQKGYNVPIMDTHKECVVTAIGTYTSELELNYTLDLSSEISLQKIRNVEIQTNFTASIASALSIKYGSGSNLEMEMHKQNEPIKEKVQPKFNLYNIIPAQFVDQIADNKKIMKHNDLQVTFTIDEDRKIEEFQKQGSVLHQKVKEKDLQ